MPEENEVYLAVPYLNKTGLETYTRLLLRKMVGLVLTSTTNIASYEEEYSANPDVSVQTTETEIEPGGIWTLPIAYGVGTGQLRVTVSGYIMYPGIDYEEVGTAGEASYQIEFKTHIASGSVIGAIVYPRQFSFGRSINVNTVAAPELAISSSPDNLAVLDENGKLLVSRSEIESFCNASVEDCVHRQGDETISGQKTFTEAPKISFLENNLSNGQTAALLEASYLANGMQYSVTPISVLAGHATDEPYSGTVLVGSNTGCTWIGSGESFLNLPETLDSSGVDFANDESVIVSSDSKFTVYVGCANDGSSAIKALQIDADGTVNVPVALKVPTASLNDNSDTVATTAYVRQAAAEMIQSMTAEITSIASTEGSSELQWDSEVILYTVGTAEIKAKLPPNPDTHKTTHLYVGAYGATANAESTENGGTHIVACDDSTARDSIKISGTGGTTVSSTGSEITIASPETVSITDDQINALFEE